MVNLSIVILNYNTRELTLRCLNSLIKQYKKELDNGDFEIVIVDNASTDNSVEMIEEKFISRHSGKRSKGAHPESLTMVGDFGQDGYRTVTRQARLAEALAKRVRMTQNGNITIVENKENFGFAKGCNIGGSVSKGKYIVFLNSDTEALDRGFLKMVDFLDAKKEIGILGGKLLNTDGSPQPSAGKFYTMINFLLLIIGGERFGWLRSSPKKIARTDWVSGACFMISRKLFDTLKGFDEHFFMYMEDMELCMRAKKLGFPTYFYPSLKLTHRSLGSNSREFAIKNIDKGILYFYKKHKAYWQYHLVKMLLGAKSAVRI